MDGNGRWARRRALPRYFGHREGVKALKTAVRYAAERGIPTLTVYAFSTENWRRPREEVDFLLDLMYKTFAQEIEELHKEGVRVRLVGDRTSLSQEIQAVWARAEQITAQNTRLTLNVAFNYGGRAELTRAARELASQVARGELAAEEITEERLASQLYTWPSPDPDLVIRTGGEQRLSNFLLWQAAYSELYVTDVLWPDFGEKEFEQALQDYLSRERRFGQVSAKEQNR
ncbi:MAG: di-trans,poly-cis-decaprenylcistransferase [Firmicutes bacterium]|jgi:undecaprenyl diphosphate synthase|nr:di-trans,poly-cis-decaprenylcistransferase [Bacillota bacterium]HBG08652.1 di-trans,poly-cis-decaprenylcistransferase [Bacillota bacterium]